MAKRYQILKNGIPVAVVHEDEIDYYYTKYDADEARLIRDETIEEDEYGKQ